MSTQSGNSWAQQLGLVATPLFGRERPDAGQQHLALLDGVRASFLLSNESDEDVSAAADWAWSSNVHHHLLVKQRQIVLSRTSGSKEIFERASVESKLTEFLRYLELDADAQKTAGAVDHLLLLFRRHRATLREKGKSPSDLESFLYLLAITQEPDAIAAHRSGDEVVNKYGLSGFDPIELNEDYVSRFVEDVSLSSASMRRLLTPLTVRHAGGALFQDAHAEILADPVQMTLFGLADAAHQRLDPSPLGAYYTPPGLARLLTEIAIEPHLKRDTIRINDPACGSGIFLCEAIRVLQRRRYAGTIILSGTDISSPAVQMARFSIACALLDWPGNRVIWHVEQGDFFNALHTTRRRFEVVLMNPPFLSWESLTSEQREFLRDVLGENFAGRPDLSMAFIQESLGYLSSGGTLATLVPRGVLDSKRGRKWRQGLLSKNDVRLIGAFSDHSLFRHAMVSIGAAVFERNHSDAATVMVWADERTNSAEAALRALRRRLSAINLLEERSNNWSIYAIKSRDLASRPSWLPTPNALGTLLDTIKKRDLPCVGQLFNVRQGIKTGLNEALIISDDELKALPTRERKHFRRVANGEDIAGGRVHSTMHIFYVPKQFQSKRQMLEAVPVFGKKLLRHETALKKRYRADPERWWEASRARADLSPRTPRILTKMFGGLNMAAVDAKGEFLPLQAYAWMPNGAALNVDQGLEEAALWWYCRVINSRIFFLLRREFAAAITAGGQLDASKKYVDDIPIPSPSRDELLRFASTDIELDVTASRKNDEIVAASYGTSIDLWPTNAAN